MEALKNPRGGVKSQFSSSLYLQAAVIMRSVPDRHWPICHLCHVDADFVEPHQPSFDVEGFRHSPADVGVQCQLVELPQRCQDWCLPSLLLRHGHFLLEELGWNPGKTGVNSFISLFWTKLVATRHQFGATTVRIRPSCGGFCLKKTPKAVLAKFVPK